MATAAQPKAYTIPKNHGVGPRERLLAFSHGPLLVMLDDESVHEMPSGTKMIVTTPRHCGDWYAEINATKHVAATGETQDAAFLAALAKLPAAKVSA